MFLAYGADVKATLKKGYKLEMAGTLCHLMLADKVCFL